MPKYLAKDGEGNTIAVPPVADVPDDAEVYMIRFTGEAFLEYEDYLARLALYRDRNWTCKFSGRKDLTYEEALLCEQTAKERQDEFPTTHIDAALRQIHLDTRSLPELCKVLKDRYTNLYVVGEHVHLRLPNTKLIKANIVDVIPVPGHRVDDDLDPNRMEYKLEIAPTLLTKDKFKIVKFDDIYRSRHPTPTGRLRDFIRANAVRGRKKTDPWILTDMATVRRLKLPEVQPPSTDDEPKSNPSKLLKFPIFDSELTADMRRDEG